MSDDQIEARHRALVRDLAALLDLEAGVREATIPARRTTLGAGLGELLDVESGLDEIVAADRPDRPVGAGRVRGTVKWFNRDKGFGFIAVDGMADVFVHYSQLELPENAVPEDGQRVEFSLAPGAMGLEARAVRAVRG